MDLYADSVPLRREIPYGATMTTSQHGSIQNGSRTFSLVRHRNWVILVLWGTRGADNVTKPCDRAVCTVSLCLLTLLPVRAVTADVQAFTDKTEWIEAVDDFAFIDFVGIPGGTLLSDEYEDLGIIFTPGENVVVEAPSIPDGFAVLGAAFFPISFTFVEPQYWVAVDFPDRVRFELYLGDKLVYESQTFLSIGVDFAFAGLLSTTPFDRVVVQDPDLAVAIDNLYIGVSVAAGPDVNGDGVVDVLDLIAVLLAWGQRTRLRMSPTMALSMLRTWSRSFPTGVEQSS